MINPQHFFNQLIAEDIKFFSGVPDSLLKNFCSYITDHTNKEQHIIAANEGNALALGIGYHLATNKLPLIYMQNSGLGNIVNPLLSLADADVYSIPMILIIGWRGEPNVKDEPQHKKQGRITLAMLDTMEVNYELLTPEVTNESATAIIQKGIRYAKETSTPFALVVKKNTFANYNLQKEETVKTLPLGREEAIKLIINELDKKDIVVSTTGVASRELFEYRTFLGQRHKKDFLTVGGMGHASQIALGIAISKPNQQVFCFDGDGATLMHTGALAINADIGCDNYKHILFNNGVHDSVGGQPTVGFKIDFQEIAKAVGYKLVLQANTETKIKDAINILKTFKGTAFLEIQVHKGFRKDLGRPTVTPRENKQALMRFLNE